MPEISVESFILHTRLEEADVVPDSFICAIACDLGERWVHSQDFPLGIGNHDTFR